MNKVLPIAGKSLQMEDGSQIKTASEAWRMLNECLFYLTCAECEACNYGQESQWVHSCLTDDSKIILERVLKYIGGLTSIDELTTDQRLIGKLEKVKQYYANNNDELELLRSESVVADVHVTTETCQMPNDDKHTENEWAKVNNSLTEVRLQMENSSEEEDNDGEYTKMEFEARRMLEECVYYLARAECDGCKRGFENQLAHSCLTANLKHIWRRVIDYTNDRISISELTTNPQWVTMFEKVKKFYGDKNSELALLLDSDESGDSSDEDLVYSNDAVTDKRMSSIYEGFFDAMKDHRINKSDQDARF